MWKTLELNCEEKETKCSGVNRKERETGYLADLGSQQETKGRGDIVKICGDKGESGYSGGFYRRQRGEWRSVESTGDQGERG